MEKACKKIDQVESRVLPKEELLCTICSDLLIKPKQCKSCEEIYCSSCIENLAKCPNSTCNSSDFSEVTRKWLKLLNETMMSCENKPDGCQKILKYEEIQKHQESECIFRNEPCDDCQQKIKSNLLEVHKEKDCPFRVIPCPNTECNFKVKFNALENHYLECKFLPECNHEKCLKCNVSIKKLENERKDLIEIVHKFEVNEKNLSIERKYFEEILKNLEEEIKRLNQDKENSQKSIISLKEEFLASQDSLRKLELEKKKLEQVTYDLSFGDETDPKYGMFPKKIGPADYLRGYVLQLKNPINLKAISIKMVLQGVLFFYIVDEAGKMIRKCESNLHNENICKWIEIGNIDQILKDGYVIGCFYEGRGSSSYHDNNYVFRIVNANCQVKSMIIYEKNLTQGTKYTIENNSYSLMMKLHI